jgi:MFS family permease
LTEETLPTSTLPLSLRQRERGKRYYTIYSIFNSISYPVLAEGVVTLFLLRLGGSEIWVGAVNALLYATLPFMLLGYLTIPRLGVTGTASVFWAIRNASAALMILAPWAAAVFGTGPALWAVFIGALGFNIGRSAGVVSFTGIITELTTERDRGDLIASSMRISQAGALIVTLLMVLFLGEHAALWRYQVFLALGVAAGLVAAWGLWQVPESGMFRDSPPFKLMEQLRWLMAAPGRRWFFAMTVLIPVTQGITRTFLILVAKQGYGLSDRIVLLYVMLGVVGGIAASYAYGLFMDKLGSRPLLMITGFVDTLALALIVLLPSRDLPWLIGLVFFLAGAVNVAYLAATQHYFIAITTREVQLPLGIVTQGVAGIAAGAAVYASGWSLENLKSALDVAVDPMVHYRWLFGVTLAIVLGRTVILRRLPRLHSHGVRDALNALMSPGDWRGVHAVKRALTIQSEDEESRALDAMRGASTSIYQDELRHFLDSPSFFVRQQALEGLALAKPTPLLIEALLEDLRVNRYLTAHISAQWLGRWQVKEAVPLLRESIFSRDFLLSAKAIHALVELGERDAYPMVLARFDSTENPLIVIESARALSLWGGPPAFPHLLRKFSQDLPSTARDELSLAVARLVGRYDDCYRYLGMYHRDLNQLRREWRERLPKADPDGPIAVLIHEPQPRYRFERALEARYAEWQEWFREATSDCLRRQPAILHPSLAFLLAFLLLAKKGEHIKLVDE